MINTTTPASFDLFAKLVSSAVFQFGNANLSKRRGAKRDRPGAGVSKDIVQEKFVRLVPGVVWYVLQNFIRFFHALFLTGLERPQDFDPLCELK